MLSSSRCFIIDQKASADRLDSCTLAVHLPARAILIFLMPSCRASRSHIEPCFAATIFPFLFAFLLFSQGKGPEPLVFTSTCAVNTLSALHCCYCHCYACFRRGRRRPRALIPTLKSHPPSHLVQHVRSCTDRPHPHLNSARLSHVSVITMHAPT